MRTVVFYYSQSGQAYEAAKMLCTPLEAGENSQLIFKQIVPQQEFPFPWSKVEFFDVFPETRLGVPPFGIKPIDLSDITDADLVIIVGQSWFLSPSLPIQSFLLDPQVREYLKGRNVIFINVCRNMWLMTSRKIKASLQEIGAYFVGQIVLQDEAPNLVSVLTIIRWLMYGKKEASSLLPAAGVAEKDLREASRLGEVIRRVYESGHLDQLQTQLLEAGAIHYKPSILMLEKVGHRMFGLWANFIRKKGAFKDPRRRHRLDLFYDYLLIVLFVLSPFAQLFFYLTYPLRHVSRQKQIDCNL